MPRRKKAECPFTLCGQSPKNGDIVQVGSESLLVLLHDDGWEIKSITAHVPQTKADARSGVTDSPNKPAGNFYIDTKGVARNAKGREILPSDVTEILLDTRPEAEREDVTKIKWADGVPRKFGELGGITIAGA